MWYSMGYPGDPGILKLCSDREKVSEQNPEEKLQMPNFVHFAWMQIVSDLFYLISVQNNIFAKSA